VNAYLADVGAATRYIQLDPGSWCVDPKDIGTGNVGSGAFSIREWMANSNAAGIHAPIMFWQLPREGKAELEDWLHGTTQGTWRWWAGLIYDTTSETRQIGETSVTEYTYWHYICARKPGDYWGKAAESAFSYNLSTSMLYSPILVPIPAEAFGSGPSK